ncbi:beta subunit of N-acylethanolamine-hydrolyzing acid amidase-domain-containing protein [Mycena floridula]|nr:beta subunit of N-acylethanolamine-hydrolyzing acid amidase-domain-containing protein [Mycena floridula]
MNQLFYLGHEPPTFQLDLSLPPRERHAHICAAFREQLAEVQSIWDDIFNSILVGFVGKGLKALAPHLLKRVFSEEETEEIKGISQASGIPIHLVVAFNTFLDLFSGCTSGGVKSTATDSRTARMLHFRGLDWEMEPLRDLVIHLELVRDGQVVARTITYAGYVGVLTAVRPGLSLSLNYRARIESSSSVFAHRYHQLMILLGRRPSIPSVLRGILLAPKPLIKSSPCYLTFCSPTSVLIVEKDLKSAVIHVSNDFLVVTNHDVRMESHDWKSELRVHGIQDPLLGDSVDRKERLIELFEESRGQRKTRKIRDDDVQRWMETRPIVNEMTHYSCLMDPSVGEVQWIKAYDEPICMSISRS